MKLCRRQYHLASISWNYFASAHGKGAIDGVGGTLKRVVTNKVRSRALLVRNAREFAEATLETAVNVKHISEATIKSNYKKIQHEIENAVEMPDITSFHQIIFDETGLRTAVISDRKINHLHVGNWVLVKYDERLYPGEITDIISPSTFKVNVMERHGKFFRCPNIPDHIYYHNSHVIRKIEPPTPIGHRSQFSFERFE